MTNTNTNPYRVTQITRWAHDSVASKYPSYIHIEYTGDMNVFWQGDLDRYLPTSWHIDIDPATGDVLDYSGKYRLPDEVWQLIEAVLNSEGGK